MTDDEDNDNRKRGRKYTHNNMGGGGRDFKILAKELGNRGGTGKDNRKVRMLLSSLIEMGVAGRWEWWGQV